ncbi:hypothetical protein R6Z07F_003868 [Ovis aries]
MQEDSYDGGPDAVDVMGRTSSIERRELPAAPSDRAGPARPTLPSQGQGALAGGPLRPGQTPSRSEPTAGGAPSLGSAPPATRRERTLVASDLAWRFPPSPLPGAAPRGVADRAGRWKGGGRVDRRPGPVLKGGHGRNNRFRTGAAAGACLPGGMMTHDNSDGPWIQGPAHLRAKMRSGGGDDAQRAGDAQSWPGRLHGPHPRPGRVQEPGDAGTAGAPAPAPRLGREGFSVWSGNAAAARGGLAGATLTPARLGLRRWPQVRPPPPHAPSSPARPPRSFSRSRPPRTGLPSILPPPSSHTTQR